jgi:hypothetical protein
MTIFTCRHPGCDFVQQYVNDDEPVACPACGGKWYRLRFCADREPEDISKVNWYEKGNERWSTSMGVPAIQVNDFRKRFPGSTYSDDGRLLIKSRSDKKRQMAERGFIEHN